MVVVAEAERGATSIVNIQQPHETPYQRFGVGVGVETSHSRATGRRLEGSEVVQLGSRLTEYPETNGLDHIVADIEHCTRSDILKTLTASRKRVMLLIYHEGGGSNSPTSI